MTASGTYVCPCCEVEFRDPGVFAGHMEVCIESSLAENLSHIGEWFLASRPQGGGTVGRIVDASALNLIADAVVLDVSEDGSRTIRSLSGPFPANLVDRFLPPEEGRMTAIAWLGSFADCLGRRSRTRYIPTPANRNPSV